MHPVLSIRPMRHALCAVILGGSLALAAPALHPAYAAGALHSASAAPAQRLNVYAVLAGTWLGPGLGDAGGCGEEYGQFTLFRNGEYAYTSNSQDCGGFTNAGYYRVRTGVLSLHWVECNYPCPPGTASARFAFFGANAFELVDGGRAYIYYRQ